MSKSFSHLVKAMSAHDPSPEARSAIPELVTARIQVCRSRLQGNRLNLVLPVILDKWSYGGVATALRLFGKMSQEFAFARIVLLNQSESEFDFSGWPRWVTDRGDNAPQSVAFLDDGAAPLQVAATDYFLATFWSTAVYVKHVIARQAELFPEASRRFVYLVQDYEPGFYPWSYRYAYTQSTYLDRDRTIAVFNCRLLSDFFRRRGLHFPEQHIYEPTLHPRLRERRTVGGEVHKERLILVYGRPSVPRNAFELIVDALRIWARTFATAGEWTVISAGEWHADISLGAGVVLQSRGKLDLDEYADYLARCWAGLSFMISPHPSYPPLEMAEFGAWVVTNSFEGKDLSQWAGNIISVDDLTPETVADRLAWCCSQYQTGRTAVIDNQAPVFKGEESEFPFLGALVSSWLQLSAARKIGGVG